MLQLWKKINASTFESSDIDKAIAVLQGEVNGKKIDVTFEGKENAPNIASIKSLFSDGNSETFLSGAVHASRYFLTYQNPDNPDDLTDRLPLSDEDIATLKFSYMQEKEYGTDQSPVITWENVLSKLEIAQVFDMVSKANRKPRESDGKVLKLAY